MKKRLFALTLLLVLAVVFAYRALRFPGGVLETSRAVPPPDALGAHCDEVIGEKRVVSIGDRIHVAIGFDLANVILVRTDEGNVIIDTAMSPSRAEEARAALAEVADGPVVAVILTHSHIDHVGGASVFAGPDTPIWGTAGFTRHFVKQYGIFREIETIRGARQFGAHLPDEDQPCSALGRPIDLDAAMALGVRMPTHTFEGEARFSIGGLTFELVEARGETHDHLFVHVPELEAVFPGDNYYRAFPNLYSIRGTAPRDVRGWIASLDAIRRRDPAVLVPSHTPPVEGREAVRDALTSYRDGIQFLHDAVVRDANRGFDVDRVAERAALPKALAAHPALQELYGQLDWSARAIYANALGWFDGRPEALYPKPRGERARVLVEMAGGADAVIARARRARDEGDPALAVELLALIRDASDDDPRHHAELASALRDLAGTLANTNGRAYLLEMALELEGQARAPERPTPTPELVDAVPLEMVFEVMATRLLPERAVDVHESVRFELGDEGGTSLTLRHGVLEVVHGAPLPGTPEPIAVIHTTPGTWKRLAMGVESPVAAIASGELRVEGSVTGLLRFLDRFRRGL